MCPPFPLVFILRKNFPFLLLVFQPFTFLLSKKLLSIFGSYRNILYFCTRFPRDGKPWDWHSDSNGVWAASNFSSLPFFSFKSWSLKKKKEKKLSKTFGNYAIKFLPLHPLSERKRSNDWQLEQKRGAWNFIFFDFLLSPFRQERRREKENEKNFENIWKIYLKVLTFATAFRKESQFHQWSDLWEIYINNTSSTRARVKLKTTLGYKTKEPSLLYINYKSKYF